MESLNKVAKITLLFWFMKIVATTLGEMFGDFLSMTLNLGYVIGIAITLLFFLAVLVIQLLQRKFIALPYWLVIVATTTLGTEISDCIDRTLNLGYLAGSLLLSACLGLTLFAWKKRYNNLMVYPVTDRGKEIFYWVAILFSNSLGTAFGDFLSDNLNLPYLVGAAITGGIIIVVVALHYYTHINAIVLFWIAFIFTRPFGATFGDFLTKPLANGGLALGRLEASAVAAVILGGMIWLAHRQHKKQSAGELSLQR